MSLSPPVTDPGWYKDPEDGSILRWWDGSDWTERTHPLSPSSPEPKLISTAPTNKAGRDGKAIITLCVVILLAVIVILASSTGSSTSTTPSATGIAHKPNPTQSTVSQEPLSSLTAAQLTGFSQAMNTSFTEYNDAIAGVNTCLGKRTAQQYIDSCIQSEGEILAPEVAETESYVNSAANQTGAGPCQLNLANAGTALNTLNESLTYIQKVVVIDAGTGVGDSEILAATRVETTEEKTLHALYAQIITTCR
jgi:hypothetical protein